MDERPWTAHYDQGVPATLQPYPQRTLLDIVRETATQRPGHPALLFKGAQLSYQALERLSNTFARALVELGVKKGERVAILVPNTPQAIIAQLGIWKAGAIAAPINALYTAPELAFALNEIGASVAVVLTPYYEKLKGLQPETAVRHVIATNVKEYLPTHLRLLFGLFREKKEGHRIQLQAGDHWFGALLKRHRNLPPPAVALAPEDPALLLFSGGTTGRPKAVLSTHQGLLMSGMQLASWFGPVLAEWDDVLLFNMPLFHTYGNAGVLPTGLVNHSPLALIPDPRDLDDTLKTIERVRPAFIPGVPTFFIGLLNHPRVESGAADLSSAKLCICGAAPLLQETKQRFEQVTGGRIVEGYAMTETVMAAVVTPVLGAYRPGKIGLPLPDVAIRVVAIDDREQVLPAGEVGEILIAAPQIMREYWQRPEATAAIKRDGWIVSGDIGYLDEDGYLAIVDRKKDLIKPGGFQVWPREVEEAIASHPDVIEVGVVGVPDPYQGEAVKAWVVRREGATLTEEELRAFCRDRLVPYKVPRQVAFVSALPKSTVGKVLRRELREEAEAVPVA